MNETLGNVSYYDSSGQNEYAFGKPYSEHTAEVIDREVSKLVEGQYARAKDILRDHKDKLTALAQQLLEKEVIFKEDLETIFGHRPFAEREQAPPRRSDLNGGDAPEGAAEETPAEEPGQTTG